MVNVLRGPAPTDKSSRLHEKPFEKPSDLLSSLQSFQSQIPQLAIWRRALALSSTRTSPPTDTRPPTKTASSCAETPADAISESRSPAAADCEGYNTVPGNTHTKSDAGNGDNGNISSDRFSAPQYSGVGTPTPNPTPSPSLEVTGSESETSSSTDHFPGSSLGSARLSFGEGQHENDISTVSHEVFAKLPDDPFRGPVQIPGCSPTTFVYPHSSAVVGAAFDERYREIVNIFRHNIKEHPRLRENLHYIDYTLKLCGTSSGDSHPSMLVFCRHSEFKDLKGLLMSKELKYQYCLRRPARKYPWSGSQASAIEEDHRPFFNLYFWRQRIPRTLYWGQESVRILNMPPQHSGTHPHIVPALTMCGSVVELLGSESSFSTLGCVIKIDSEFYATTSMHAFRLFEPMETLYSEEMSDCRSVGRSSAGASVNEAAELLVFDEEPLYGSDTDPSDALLEDGDFFIDDVEYESLSEDDEGELDPIDSRSTVADDSCGNQIQTSDQTREAGEILALFPTPHELDESGELDLDWALIKLVDQQDWRPNAFVYSSGSSNPVFLSKVAESQPTLETPVFIITGERTPQRGMLQPGTSLLGGINGRTPSTMWTVVLSEQSSLKRGDSGSIVVDATTNTIYGHVVGSNPIGEVYISSYAAILEQIQHRFPGSAVSIPEPISTLACLIDFYTMSVRDESGLESLGWLEEAYRTASAGLEVEQISPRFLQSRSSDAAAGAPGDQECFSMPHSTATACRFNTINDQELAAVADTAQPSASLVSLFASLAPSRASPFSPTASPTATKKVMAASTFKEVSFATKALHGLYGHMIHNSVERGIPLSFSKNLLGVRSGPTPGQKASATMGGMNDLISGPRSGFMTADGPSNTINPTFEGHIGSTIDALVLFEACLSGQLNHVPRQPQDSERQDLIRSGSVFIYSEHASGIKRWTDGVSWSPSRILGNFLIYRELEKPFAPGKKKLAIDWSKPPRQGVTKRTSNSCSGIGSPSAVGPNTAGKDTERALIGSLIDSYPFKNDGLIKKTIGVSFQGVPHHLVSYYNVNDITSGKLATPTKHPNLRNVIPRPELIISQRFSAPIEEVERASDERFMTHPIFGTLLGREFGGHGSVLQSAVALPSLQPSTYLELFDNILEPSSRSPAPLLRPQEASVQVAEAQAAAEPEELAAEEAEEAAAAEFPLQSRQYRQYGQNDPGYFGGEGRGMHEMMSYHYSRNYGGAPAYGLPPNMQQYQLASPRPPSTKRLGGKDIVPLKEDPKAIEIQKQVEAQIREDAEGDVKERLEARRLEAMLHDQEEARKAIKMARIKAGHAALMRIELKRKVEEERARMYGEIMKKVEEKARLRFEADEAKAKAQAADINKRIEEETKSKIAHAAEQAPIRFKDALGRKFSFPFHLCLTWQGMEGLIKAAFLQVDVLGPHVQEGHYDLIGPDAEIILPSVWEKVVQPDWAIFMAMWPMEKLPSIGPKMPDRHGMPQMSDPWKCLPECLPSVAAPVSVRRDGSRWAQGLEEDPTSSMWQHPARSHRPRISARPVVGARSPLEDLLRTTEQLDDELRNSYQRKVSQYEAKQLVFVDEPGCDKKAGQ